MKSKKHYDCYELQKELKAIGWTGDLLQILESSDNGYLTYLCLKEQEEYDDDYQNLVKYVKQLGFKGDTLTIHVWW